MRTRIAFTFLLVICLLGSGLLLPALPATAQPFTAVEGNVGCIFGYTLQSLVETTQWQDIHLTGQTLDFGSHPDDVIVQVPNIGFNFPFFEKSYSSVYVSTNGFITFNPYQNAYADNFAIPMEIPPNNIVAGFWDDLQVGAPFNSGVVYFKMLGSSPNRLAVFEWYHVARFDSTDLLTFEIVLKENGDVFLNYDSLNGVLNQATAGIEDSDGVDGYQIVANTSGLTSHLSYRLVYPASGYRGKAKPLYQGGFLTNGLLDLPLTVVNSGTNPDSFNYQTNITGSPEGQVKIVDDQGAFLGSTPLLNPGQSFSANIRVSATKTTNVGQKWSGTVTVISNGNSNRRFVVSFDAASPIPFATMFVDSGTASTRYISKDQQTSPAVFSNFKGTNFSIARLPGFEYMLTWQETGNGPHGPYQNIKKAITAPFTGLISPITNLADNSVNSELTFDESAQVAVAPNGTIGLVYVRWTPNSNGDQVNANIFFARLDLSGNLLPPVKNLTQSNMYFADLVNNHPVISATPGNLFVITYEALTPLGGLNAAKDIDLITLDTSGTVVQAAHALTDSQNSGANAYSPASTVMQDGSIFIAFLSNQTDQPSNVSYTIYHPGDNSVDDLESISDPGVKEPRLDTLSNGKIVLAWVRSSALSVGYVLFDAEGGILNASPLELASPNGWKLEQISLAATPDGNATFSWKDEWSINLYYALIDASGNELTSPMVFMRGSNSSNPILLNSSTGKGIAALTSIQNFFSPLVKK